MLNRDVGLLALCQALLNTGNVLLVSVSVLIGSRLADAQWLSTLPMSIQFLGALCATMPASLLMRRIGRKRGFLIGNGLGMAGALLCTLGLYLSSLAWFCVGTLLLGACIGFGQYYRFAAVDAAPGEQKSRAISMVMSGGVVAALAGPSLAVWSRGALESPLYTGSFLALLVLYLFSSLLLLCIRIPAPASEEVQGAQRPVAMVARQPVFWVAVLAGVVSYSVMALIMTATPLAMAERGFSFSATAHVIQWHVLAMFAPSFVTGHLIKRFGVVTVMLTGALLLLASIVINLSGAGAWHFWLALLVLGLGWNFLFIGATNLVTEAYWPAEKAKIQGVNDLCVSASVALATFLSGTLQALFGWWLLNLAMLLPVGMALIILLWYRRARQRQASYASTALES